MPCRGRRARPRASAASFTGASASPMPRPVSASTTVDETWSSDPLPQVAITARPTAARASPAPATTPFPSRRRAQPPASAPTGTARRKRTSTRAASVWLEVCTMRASSGTSTTTATSATRQQRDHECPDQSPAHNPRAPVVRRSGGGARHTRQSKAATGAGRSRAAHDLGGRVGRREGEHDAAQGTAEEHRPSRSARRSSGQAPRPDGQGARRNTAATRPIGVASREVASPIGTNGTPRRRWWSAPPGRRGPGPRPPRRPDRAPRRTAGAAGPGRHRSPRRRRRAGRRAAR